MPYYEWKGASDFQDNQNDRVIEHGDVVELPERVAGNHDFVEVEAPEEEVDPQGSDGEITCAEGDCSRTVDEAGMKCWQHEDE